MKSCTRHIIRINQLRIINSKLSLRRSEADAVASLKFIILSVPKSAILKYYSKRDLFVLNVIY